MTNREVPRAGAGNATGARFEGVNILFVDDSPNFLKVVKSSLDRAGANVVTAEDGKAAKDILQLGEFDVVISDIQMPEMNGIELTRFIKSGDKELPVILITGFSELVETQQAAKLGADGFIAKPFKKEELFAVLSEVLSKKRVPDSSIRKSRDSEFSRIHIDEFISGRQIRFSIYIRLSESNYVKIANQGEDLSPGRIQNYKEKGINELYLRQEDFRSYVGFAVSLVPAVTSAPALPKEKKLQFLRHTTEMISAELFSEGVNEELLYAARVGVETTIALVSDHIELLGLLSSMKEEADYLYAHSVGVALYSVVLAKAVGWTSPQTLFKVSMGGLLHDIGIKETPRELWNMPRHMMSPEQVSLYESHTVRGFNILCKIQSIPEDVAKVAYQHHEDCLGMGYPCGLNRSQIHPIAKLVSLADCFISLFMGTPGFGKIPGKLAAERIGALYSDRYDAEFLCALLGLFELAPREGLLKQIKMP